MDWDWEHIQVLRVACSASPKVHPITGTLASELTQEDIDRFKILDKGSVKFKFKDAIKLSKREKREQR